MKLQEFLFEDLPYLRCLPSNFDEGKRYPVVIFLHGAGSRESMEKLIENPFFCAKENPIFGKAIVYAPCCMWNSWFDDLKSVRNFTEMIAKEKTTDVDRISLVGASMGGYAVWQLAISDPDRYSAVIPICGGGMAWATDRLTHLPIWAFHGEDDTVVSCEESKRMVNAVNQSGGNAKLTVFENTGHDAWTSVYHNPEVFLWLLNQKKGGQQTVCPDTFDNVKEFG